MRVRVRNVRQYQTLLLHEIVIILVFGFLFIGTCECKEPESPASREEISKCENCRCLAEVGNFLFAGSDAADKEPGVFQSTYCKSPDLPPPGNLMAEVVVNRDRINSGSGGSLENCGDQWDNIVENLSSRNYQKECSAGSSTSELLTRCDEDQFILSQYIKIHTQQSAGGNLPSTDASDGCKDAEPVFSALNVLVRFENTAFLNDLIASGSLENLIRNGDEGTKMALYILTQHSENFPQVQVAILTLRKSLLEEGIGEPRDVAALADRIQIMQNGTQLYGTHTSCKSKEAILAKPVDDIDAANKRRDSIGLSTIHEFLALASKSCVQNL